MFRNWRWLLLVLLVSFSGVACVVPDEITARIDPETIKLIFDRVEEIRAKIKKDIDELSERNITRLEKLAQRLRENTKRDILEIEAQLNKDINILVDRIDEKYRSAARELFQKINQARAEALADVRYSIGFIDEKLEARITQMSKTLMEMVTRLDKTADKFRPEKLRSEIIEPTFAELDKLTDKIMERIDQLVDKIGCKVGGTVSSIEESLRELLQETIINQPCQSCIAIANQNPEKVDISLNMLAGMVVGKKPPKKSSPDEHECSCCQSTRLLDKNKKTLKKTTDIKLFRYHVCMLTSELDMQDKVSDIVDTYAVIQSWAMEVYCKSDLSRVTPEELAIQKIMREEAAQAYDNYSFWSKFVKEN